MLAIIERGGPVMYPLVALSFLSIAVVVERLLFWLRLKLRRNWPVVKAMLQAAEEGDLEGATAAGEKCGDYIARTLLNGLKHRAYSLTIALETQSMIELKRMRKNLVVLDTIITAAPLLGILGTVIGIIISFDVLGVHGIADPKAVTSGISQALLTTAYGLSVSLFTIFPYNYFQAKYDNAVEKLEKYGSTLEMLVKRKASP